MRTTSVFINKLSENGFPFSGKVKFTLMSTDPDYSSYRKPVEAFFINGKAKVQLIPNIFISRNVSTYYHYEIFAQHPVNSPTEVAFEKIEEGDCIVPIKPSCLQEILIPTQSGSAVSACNCEPEIEAINSEIAEIKDALVELYAVQPTQTEHQPCVVTGWYDWSGYEPEFQ